MLEIVVSLQKNLFNTLFSFYASLIVSYFCFNKKEISKNIHIFSSIERINISNAVFDCSLIAGFEIKHRQEKKWIVPTNI